MSLASRLKGWIDTPLDRLGLELRRKTAPQVYVPPRRDTMPGLLQHARDVGFRPGTVVDVGAALGSFTRLAHTVFPEATNVLIEPLAEYASALRKLTAELPQAHHVPAAAAACTGRTHINVHADLFGSSLYVEGEESGVNGVPREIDCITLETLLPALNAPGPYLVKIDVQGAELDVLAGAEAVLEQAGYLLLEISCFRFFRDGPDFPEVVRHLRERGFVPYDVCGLAYRPLDNALAQLDIAFVREDGPFRRHHHYASAAQRSEQDRKLADLVGRRLEVVSA